MKYKEGDKIKIKTWESMENEYGVGACENICGDILINCKIGITLREYRQFISQSPDRVMIIEKIEKHGYVTNIKRWFDICWHEDMIKKIVK